MGGQEKRRGRIRAPMSLVFLVCCRRFWHAFGLHGFDDGIGELAGGSGAAHIARDVFLFTVDDFDGAADLLRGFLLAEVPEHEDTGAEQRGRVCHVLTGDVRGGAVDGFEDSAVVSVVGARNKAEALRQTRRRDR